MKGNPKNSRGELKKFWSERLNDWKVSEKSGAEWCKEQGFSYRCFLYWKKALQTKQEPATTTNRFTELVDKPPIKKNSGVKIQYSNLFLSVDTNFDEATLSKLIHLLQRDFPC